jgi:hypothetical protein
MDGADDNEVCAFAAFQFQKGGEQRLVRTFGNQTSNRLSADWNFTGITFKSFRHPNYTEDLQFTSLISC